MPSADDYVADLAAHGRYYFTTEEAVAALGEPVDRVRAGLRRLKQKREIAVPHRSFHLIVPHDHKGSGCLPAEIFMPPLMQHLHEPYYVALLSAAEMYGAGDSRHAMQVMTRQNRKPIHCGKYQVQFVGRRELTETPVLERPMLAGALRVASPEATALELVGYANKCGGLHQVALVLSELVPSLDPDRLVEAAPLAPIVWAQRLGYLLDVTGNRGMANALVPVVREQAQEFAPLVRARPKAGTRRVPRWKLSVNASI